MGRVIRGQVQGLRVVSMRVRVSLAAPKLKKHVR